MKIDYQKIVDELSVLILDLWKNHKFSHKALPKGEADIVTETDLNFEKAILKKLNELTPEIPILSEETLSQTEQIGTFYTVDPVDGTWNFAHSVPLYGTQVALIEDGEPTLGIIYMPTFDQLFTAFKGNGTYLNGERVNVQAEDFDHCIVGLADFRRKGLDTILNLTRNLVESFGKTRVCGASCFDYSRIACGDYQGKITYTPNLWDVAPGVVLTRESGGAAVLTKEYAIAAASEEILKKIQECYEKSVIVEELFSL